MDPSTKRVRVAMALAAIYLIWGTTYLAVAITDDSARENVESGK